MRALIFGRGLAENRPAVDLCKRAAVRADADRVADAPARYIAIGRVGARQRGDADGDAHRRKLCIGNGANPWREVFQLHADADFVLNRIEAGNVILSLRAGALLDVRARKVAGSVIVGQRRLVEIDRLLAVHQTANLTL